MSIRSDIMANLVSALGGVAGVRQVTEQFKTIDNVPNSQMPYVMAISGPEERERFGASKMTECVWETDVWCYMSSIDQIETYVDALRVAILADLSRGSYAIDTVIPTIMTAQIGAESEYGLAVLTVAVKYRVREPA